MEWEKAFQFYWTQGTRIIKKNTAYILFFLYHQGHHHQGHHHQVFKSSLEGGIREWPITAADVASLVVVVNARVTHQRESAGEARVRREVRAVVKSSVTRHTQAELVFVEFRHSLFLRKLEPGFVGIRRFHSRRASSGSSSSPVAGSNMLGHRSSFACL